ncbi:MAG: hypothetical protein K8T25_21080 [Planctomycetia bacterium]|nr:hypothetical protein [Planctomycetia bacterium]
MVAAAMTLILLTAAAGKGYEPNTNYNDETASESDGADYSLETGWGMPQTCYAPRYGCYPGNDRFVHRYPAFHGTYYRRPYNYRNLFDYPWHAELHEPTSMFSYHVPAPDDEPRAPRSTNDDAPRPPRSSRLPKRERSVMMPAQPVSATEPADGE